MAIKPELQEQHAQQTAILADLKAALVTADAADQAEIQSMIGIYESALADPAYQDDYNPVRDLTTVELVIAKHQGFSDSQVNWHAAVAYKPGQQVFHNGKVYTAMADVAAGQQPDDVYDLSANTGGWVPEGVVVEDTVTDDV